MAQILNLAINKKTMISPEAFQNEINMTKLQLSNSKLNFMVFFVEQKRFKLHKIFIRMIRLSITEY